jgi:hypothetical protein
MSNDKKNTGAKNLVQSRPSKKFIYEFLGGVKIEAESHAEALEKYKNRK